MRTKTAKTTYRIWEKELGKDSQNVLGVHLLLELVNHILWYAHNGYWEANLGESLDSVVEDFDTDLKNYYYCTYKCDCQKERLEEAVMSFVVETVRHKADINVLYLKNKPIAVGLKEIVEEEFADTIKEMCCLKWLKG